MTSAVLFLVFRRPEPTQRVFAAIRAARPPRLYVAADGPRADRPGEAVRCEEVRRIASAIDWPCELKTRFRDTNAGCKEAVSSAISWFFDQEDEGIVLEDDCLPHPDFFGFAEEMLARYRTDNRILCINGNHSLGSVFGQTDSYYYTAFPNIWGWASWRRAWRLYDVTMAEWPRFRDDGGLQRVFGRNRLSRQWTRVLDQTHQGAINTWDFQFVFAVFKQGGLCVQPYQNLITNIGHGPAATFTTDPLAPRANQPTHALPVPLIHPEQVVRILLQCEYSLSQQRPIKRALGALARQPWALRVWQRLLRLRRPPRPTASEPVHLNIGCGGNPVREPGWINLDLCPARHVFYGDARRPLPFPNTCATTIFTEHMIEHLTPDEARAFLRECRRVLQPDGVLRVATPDLAAVGRLLTTDTPETRDYLASAGRAGGATTRDAAVNQLFYGHGHRQIFSADSLAALLAECGFRAARRAEVGQSEHPTLRDRERHGDTVGAQANRFETLVMEARK